MGTNVKVLISCHKETDVINTECFMPVQVGTSLAKKELPGMAHDNDGDNISELNPMYCELTAQYWAWKIALTSWLSTARRHTRTLLML